MCCHRSREGDRSRARDDLLDHLGSADDPRPLSNALLGDPAWLRALCQRHDRLDVQRRPTNRRVHLPGVLLRQGLKWRPVPRDRLAAMITSALDHQSWIPHDFARERWCLPSCQADRLLGLPEVAMEIRSHLLLRARHLGGDGDGESGVRVVVVTHVPKRGGKSYRNRYSTS